MILRDAHKSGRVKWHVMHEPMNAKQEAQAHTSHETMKRCKKENVRWVEKHKDRKLISEAETLWRN